MKQVGIKKLDFILGTHVHSDHIGSADEVLKRFPVDRFYLKRYTDERITTNGDCGTIFIITIII